MPKTERSTTMAKQIYASSFAISTMVFVVAITWLPSPEGLSIAGLHMLLLTFYVIALWVTEAIPPPLAGLLAMVLLPLLNIVTFPKAVAGFGDTTVWLLLGVYIISAAMRESRFDRRLALTMINLSRGNSKMIIFMVNAITTVFVFLLPTSSGRASLMTPICVGIIQAMGLRQDSYVAKAMLISVSYVSLIGSMGLMTGAISMVYSVSLFGSLAGYKWTYIGWMQAMLPVSIACNLLLGPLLLKVYPPELPHLPEGIRYIQAELQSLKGLSSKEVKVILLLSLTISCWILEDIVHLSVAQSCLMASLALMLPGINVISWKKASASIEWGAILLLASSIGMVEGLKSTHAIEWVTNTLFSRLPGLSALETSIILMLLLILVRLGFPNLLAMVATTLPVAFSLAHSLGLNPIWLGMLCVASTVIGFFLPTQSITHLVTFGSGYYSTGDMFKAGVPTTLLVTLIIILSAHLYWPILGISPTLK